MFTTASCAPQEKESIAFRCAFKLGSHDSGEMQAPQSVPEVIQSLLPATLQVYDVPEQSAQLLSFTCTRLQSSTAGDQKYVVQLQPTGKMQYQDCYNPRCTDSHLQVPSSCAIATMRPLPTYVVLAEPNTRSLPSAGACAIALLLL